MQDQHRRAGGHLFSDTLYKHWRRQHAVDRRDARPTRLPGRRADHRSPPTQTLVDTRPVPVRHAARRLPCQERVGSGFGGQLDCQFGAFGFGQRLHHGHRWPHGRDAPAPKHPGPQPATSGLLHHTAGQATDTVTKHQLLAGTDPPHGGGVKSFVAVYDRHRTGVGQCVDVKQHRHHVRAVISAR
ncbi:Uncharacterised protein [Mycobacterium tuberculosis]|nr:Uncharacterised protein [Mycobacterium tuberculosis]